MTTCEPCALYDQGQSTETADGIRIQQLLLTALSGRPDAEAEMLTELNKCPGCTVRLAARLTYVNAALLVRVQGAVENVRQGLELGLIEDTNDLPPDD